jgi:hypothetical protein
VASQFKKLPELNDGDEINLWFEYELFCSVNMWFCIDLLSDTGATIYRVEPVYLINENRWDGFGGATPERMRDCFAARTKFTDDDVELGSALWAAYRSNDDDTLRILSDRISPVFPYLNELCHAAVERDVRPAEILREIRGEGVTDFADLFLQFKKRAGVYGFGDNQVRRLVETNVIRDEA